MLSNQNVRASMDIVYTLLLAVIGSTIAHSGSASTRNRSGPAAAAMKTLTTECSANQRAPLFGVLFCAIAYYGGGHLECLYLPSGTDLGIDEQSSKT